MNKLPNALRMAPKVFYTLAIFSWIYRVVSNLSLIQTTQDYIGLDADRTAIIEFILKSEHFAAGLIDAAYMAANGAIIHVLIAIYDKLKGPAE